MKNAGVYNSYWLGNVYGYSKKQYFIVYSFLFLFLLVILVGLGRSVLVEKVMMRIK